MIKTLTKDVVLIRGAGELATGVGWVLAKAGFRVIMTEIERPLMVRWPVCFGTAIGEEIWEVEGITAVRTKVPLDCPDLWENGKIPVLIDPLLSHLEAIKPKFLIDAIIAKRNIGTHKKMAEFTIGLGPGFTAEVDVHLVIETNRGHNLGRLIYGGQAEPNTGIPGEIGGYTKERVLYSPEAGLFKAQIEIGETVYPGDLIGEIQTENNNIPISASIQGVLRGLLRHNTPVEAKIKIGDIDARGKREYCFTISEKARMIGATVLLALSEYLN